MQEIAHPFLRILPKRWQFCSWGGHWGNHNKALSILGVSVIPVGIVADLENFNEAGHYLIENHLHLKNICL
jgi:hypothetical protein